MGKVILEHDGRGAKMCLGPRKCGPAPRTLLTIADKQLIPKAFPLAYSAFLPELVVQSLNHVWHLAISWTAARQVPLASTVAWSLLKLMSIESVILSNRLILCHPLLLLSSIFPSIRVFSDESALHQLAKTLELQPLSFQWISFWRKVLLVYILEKYFAMCVVHSLSGALSERWGGMLSLFSGSRTITLSPGPQKALSLKAQLLLSPSICLKSSVPPSDPAAGQLENDSWKRTSIWEHYSLNDGYYCVCYLQHKWKHSAMLKLPLEECSSEGSKPFRKYRTKMLQKWSLKVLNNSWWASKGLPLERGTEFHSSRREHILSIFSV